MEADELPVEVFTELGRVTWAAIRLEDYTESVCQCVDPHNPRTDHRQIGRKVKEATATLHTWPPSRPRDDALAWLARATAALDRRNAILHATPVVLLGAPGSQPTQMLGAMPRKGSAYTQHPLTADHLGGLEATLRGATQGWMDVQLAASEECSRPRSVQRGQ